MFLIWIWIATFQSKSNPTKRFSQFHNFLWFGFAYQHWILWRRLALVSSFPEAPQRTQIVRALGERAAVADDSGSCDIRVFCEGSTILESGAPEIARYPIPSTLSHGNASKRYWFHHRYDENCNCVPQLAPKRYDAWCLTFFGVRRPGGFRVSALA